MIIHPEHPELRLLEAADLQPAGDASSGDVASGTLTAASAVLDWARTYLSVSHPELGRPGPVCPYVPSALRSGTLYVAAPPRLPSGPAEVERALAAFRDWFPRLAEGNGDRAELTTILVIFPGLPESRYRELVDDVQERLKASFVEQGLMVGQFHPGPPEQPGLWNPGFRPLHAPVPLLAIRAMVPNDLPFLTDRSDFLRPYQRRFADVVPSRFQEMYDEACRRLGEEDEPGGGRPGVHPHVACALARHGITPVVHLHAEQATRIETPADMAAALGYPAARITKTLLLEADDARLLRVVLGSGARVDLRRTASHLRTGRMRLAASDSLSTHVGQAPGGVSPLGAAKVPVVLDAALMEHPTVLVGAGTPGVELEISPQDLARAAAAQVLPISAA